MALIATAYTAPSLHWYTKDGEPRHDATLREARKENLFPSVTSILNELASPELENWKKEQLILACSTLPRQEGEDTGAFLARVIRDSESYTRSAADLGTAAHDWLDRAIQTGEWEVPPELEKIGESLRAAKKWIDENLDLSAGFWVEDSMVSGMGYAGRVDFQGFLKNGRPVIIDWKTQNVTPKKGKASFYDKYLWQLTGYCEGKTEDFELVSVVIGSNPDCQGVWSKVWELDEKMDGWDIFRACLRIWQLKRGYKPQKGE